MSYSLLMVVPAPKPPAGNHNDEALDILRRLEPALARFEAEQKEQRRDIVKLKEDTAGIRGHLKSVAMREDVAHVDGRVGELSARVPSIWTIAAMIVSLFGAAFVLIRLASGHG